MHSRGPAVNENSGHMHGRHSHAEAPPWLLKLGILFTSITFGLGMLFWQLSEGSVVIFSDALHSFFHIAIYSIALWGNVSGRRHKQARAGKLIGTLILAIAVYIGASGTFSIISPGKILSSYMIIMACIALVSEATLAILKLRVQYKGVPVRKIFLIKALLRDDFIDIFASLGVLVSGVVIIFTGFYRADGIAAVPIALAALYMGIVTIMESRDELKISEPTNNHVDYKH